MLTGLFAAAAVLLHHTTCLFDVYPHASRQGLSAYFQLACAVCAHAALE
jgi:hypothetical protein